jgi:hypothetical protein
MLRCLLWALAAAVQPKALLIADNLCLRQQLVVLLRRKPRPRLEDVDRRFWIRWHNGRPAHRGQMRLIGAVKLERSPQYPCSEAYITFISKPHDDDAALILAPYR